MKIKFHTSTSECSPRRKFKPRPLTVAEFQELEEVFIILGNSHKRTDYSERAAFEDYTWNHYAVGFLIETLREKFKEDR